MTHPQAICACIQFWGPCKNAYSITNKRLKYTIKANILQDARDKEKKQNMSIPVYLNSRVDTF